MLLFSHVLSLLAAPPSVLNNCKEARLLKDWFAGWAPLLGSVHLRRAVTAVEAIGAERISHGPTVLVLVVL